MPTCPPHHYIKSNLFCFVFIVKLNMYCNNQIIMNKRLMKAVAKNDVKDCRCLIELGADVNSDFTVDDLIKKKFIDDNAITLLKKSVVSVQEHCEKGTDPRLVHVKKDQWFHNTLFSNHECTAVKTKFSPKEKLIVLPLFRDRIILSYESRISPLQVATFYGWKEVMIELIKAGANPNKVLDIQGMTILHLVYTTAVFSKSECFIFDENLVQLMLDHGADPNIQDVNGMTPLFSLSNRSFLCILKDTLSGKKELSEITDHGVMKRVERFLISGGNPNIKDRYQNCTVLYDIIAHDKYLDAQPDLTNILLDHGSLYGTAEDILKQPGISSMMQEEYGRNYDPENEIDEFYSKHKNRITNNDSLIEAIKEKDMHKISQLLHKVNSLNIRDKDGLSALHHAVKVGEIEVIDSLLKKGADPNIKSWKNGTTPLFNAVVDNRVDIAELLLKHEANPNILNFKLLSPLYFSITNAGDEMTNLLLQYNANPDVSNKMAFLFDSLNTVKDDSTEIVDGIFKKINDVSKFLKSRGISIDFSLFYQSLDIAENKHKENIERKIVELLEELFY